MRPRQSAFVRFCAVTIFLIAGFSAGLTQARANDPALGRTIAQKWCSGCHLVEPGGKTIDAAPSFEMLANTADYTDSRLRGWLFAPHPPMPQIALTDVQTDAIIAYIRSLKRQ
jgi:mono/diheme cytochrome c family protein